VTDHLRVLAEEKEQHLGVEIRSAIKTEADPTLLRQGLINLLDNAIKYTPAKGTIDVRVTATRSGDAAIEVEDTGPGIAPLDRDRIFERFYRVDAARSRDAGGVGLGLAIARWAVEVNGGHIELDTEEGRGSLFRMVLRRVDR
jgi:signal transduction histidine kinase